MGIIIIAVILTVMVLFAFVFKVTRRELGQQLE